METLAKSPVLETLEQHLQQCLSHQLSSTNSLSIECLLEEEKLKVWVQHKPTTFLEEQSVFTALQGGLTKINPPLSSQVRLYLKREGQKQPYAVSAFKIPRTTLTPEPSVPKPTPTPKPSPPKSVSDIPEFLETIRHKPSTVVVTQNERAQTEQMHTERTTTVSRFHEVMPWLPLGMVGGIAGSLFLLGFGYTITRPCVIGDCPAIARSQELSQNAIQNLDAQRSTEALLAAQPQLEEAKRLMEKIPFWSIHHRTAQELLEMNRHQTQALKQTATALSHAAMAGQKSQNPPHPPQVWQEVRQLWEKAIAQLEQIPESSPTYGFAQQKISEYQANLEAIEQRLTLEEKAQLKLQTAKEAAEAAQARHTLARDLEAWQLTNASWKTTMYALRRVPKGTKAAHEAEELFTAYESQIVAAREHYTQEQIAANFYNQALTFGDRAQAAQNNSDWNQAILQWQQGLAHARQVPPQTSSYEDTQVLISSYTKSLDEAIQRQRQQSLMARANLELNSICAGTTPICEYTVTRQGIKVQILPSYIDYIRELAQTSKQTQDQKTQTSIEEHKQALINSFKTVSNNAQLSIALYQKSDGSLIGFYQPKAQ